MTSGSCRDGARRRGVIWRASVTVALTLAAGSSSPRRAASQAATNELTVARCYGCRLTQSVIAVLGRATDSVLVVPTSRVARIGSDRYIVGPVSVPGQLAIYKADGSLERVIGREGSGPAEFSRYFGRIIAAPDGAVIVVDMGTARLTWIDSLGKAAAARRVYGSVWGGVSLSDGRLVLNARYRTPELFGFPLHLFDATGAIVRSFGEIARAVAPTSGVQFRTLAATRDGGVWSSPDDTYHLNLTDSLGRVRLTLTRPFKSAPAGPSGALSFGVSSIYEARDGRVWVVTAHRDSEPAVRKDAEITAQTLSSLARGLTSRIDIIDPRRRTLVFSQAFDGPPTLLIGDGIVQRYREDATGQPRIEIVSLRLIEPTTDGRR